MSDQQIRTWNHSRKGPIVGVVAWESDEWMDVRLIGEQTLRYASIENRLLGPHPDGDVVRVRKSFMAEVTA